MIGFCLGSDWFRGWREFSGLIADLGKAQVNNSGLLPTLVYGLWYSNHVLMLNSPRVRSCGYSNKSDEACVFPTGNERGRKVSLVYLWRPRTRKLHSCRCPSVSFAYRLSLQSVHFLISLKNKRLRQSTNRINTAAWVGFLFLVSIEFSAFLVFLPLGIGFQILLADLNFLRYHFSLF